MRRTRAQAHAERAHSKPACRHSVVVLFQVAPLYAVLGREVVRADRATGAVRVQLGHAPLVFQLFEHRREDLPRRVELVISDKQPLVTCRR